MSSDSEDIDDVEPDPETVDVSAFTVIPIMLVLSFSFKFSLKSLMRHFQIFLWTFICSYSDVPLERRNEETRPSVEFEKN